MPRSENQSGTVSLLHANPVLQQVALAWCLALAKTVHKQLIQPNGTPYLERYFVAGWNPITKRPGPSIFLHHFVASDPDDAVHSHPWGWSASLILSGGYREERCHQDGTKTVTTYRPGDLNVIDADVRHRVELLESDCWTLFLSGAVQQQWAFYDRC